MDVYLIEAHSKKSSINLDLSFLYVFFIKLPARSEQVYVSNKRNQTEVETFLPVAVHRKLYTVIFFVWMIFFYNFKTTKNILKQFFSFLVKNMITPWNFPKYMSLTKEVDWRCHLRFLMSSKIGFWSVYYTPVMLSSQ